MSKNLRILVTAQKCAFAFVNRLVSPLRAVVFSLAVLLVVFLLISDSSIRRTKAFTSPSPNVVSLVSANSAGTNSGDGPSSNAVVSANGRYVAFTSTATNLSNQIDTNGQPDVFVRDLLNGRTELISRRNSSNFSANGPSGALASDNSLGISADGRYVVYSSEASDLVSFDDNNVADVFVYDRVVGFTRRVSVKNGDLNASANGPSGKATISANGKIIVYTSSATNLTSVSDTNAKVDVFAFDQNILVAKMLSINAAGTNGGNDPSSVPSARSISDDGRFVVFESQASDLVPNDGNGTGVFGSDVFVRDLQTNSTSLVSANATGTGTGNLDSNASGARISANGQFVVFASRATNLVNGITDANGGLSDVFRRDLTAGTTSLVSINLAGTSSGSDLSESPSISDDGRFVAFASRANNLVATDTNNGQGGSDTDTFVRDMQSGVTKLVSLNTTGTDSGNSDSTGPTEISSDGRFVLFASTATNLTTIADNNSSPDLFLRDTVAETTTLVSIDRGNTAGRANATGFSMSDDASAVGFESTSPVLVANDSNQAQDVFAWAPPPPGLSVNDVSITEGDSGTVNAVFTVTLTNGPASGNVTVSAMTLGNSASQGSDFQFTSASLTFAPGETTKTVSVPVIGDLVYEGNETFDLLLQNPTGAALVDNTGTATIVDNEPVPSLSVNDITIAEGDSGTTNAVFTVTLSGPSAFQSGFSFSLANGTATAQEDFSSVSGGDFIFPGLTSKTITVPIIGDTITEGNETFFINLANPTNSTIADSQGVATIVDNDGPSGPATFQFAARFVTVPEAAGSVVITVTRTGASNTPASVNYSTSSNGGASDRSDYTLALGTLNFAAGETSKTVTVLLTDDSFVEGNEVFLVNLSNPTNGVTIGLPNQAVVTISDNDSSTTSNPIDGPSLFVQQHYHDFLNREPDPSGFAFWQNEITQCGADAACIENKRINVSAAFFLSIEFQETGNLVYRFYKSGFGNLPGAPVPVRYTEFVRDTQRIGQGVQVGVGNWQEQLETNKQEFALAFVQRPEFTAAFPTSMTGPEFVNGLDSNAGGVLSPEEKANLVAVLGSSPSDVTRRAQVLRAVAEDQDLKNAEFNKSFVLMQYFGYLRRNPNDAPDSDFTGYNFWLAKLNQFNGNYIEAEMVKAFIVSAEYRHRFGP
ncbi:MAG TPA: Calx-beta domain-containing protein [Pyrinomonadaceae bacterium]